MPTGLARLVDPDFELTPLVELENRLWLDLAAGTYDRIGVVAPPRHGKTYLSKYGWAWYLGNWPSRKGMEATYNLQLARETTREVRDLLQQHGRDVYGVRVRGDAGSATDWKTDQGGGMLAGGRQGGFTGRGAHLIHADDLFKNQDEAESPTVQKEAIRFLRTTLTTRLEKNGAILITNTRWTENDVFGYIVARQRARWTPERRGLLVRVPAIADGLDFEGKLPMPDPCGRPTGAALWEDRYPLGVLEDRRGEVGPVGFKTVYQGLPARTEGRLFQRSDFRYWSVSPTSDAFVLHKPGGQLTVPRGACTFAAFMDLGATDELEVKEDTDPDWSVISVWAYAPEGDMLLVDVMRERVDTTKQEAMYDEARRRWKCLVHIEKAFIGIALVQNLKKRGRPFAAVDADRNKVARARALQAKYQLGSVYHPDPDLVDAPWLSAWEDEVLDFPKGDHDDQVDTGAYAAAHGAKWATPRVRSLYDDAEADASNRRASET
jgi:predicted phage terminase large subunit-like protein